MRNPIAPSVKRARVWRATALAFALTLGIAGSLRAQGNAPTPASPGTLTGVVTDTYGAPIENVDVAIAKLRRRTRTRADGSFRFDSVAPGTYDVTARGIGLVASTTRLSVSRDGGSFSIRMVRFGTVLAPKVTTASMSGLSGIIGDTTYRALPDVKVTVIGGGRTAHTDSTGAFFLPLKPGQYMLRIEREGFARQIAGVSIPKNEGRRISAWLVPQTNTPNPLEATRLFDLNQRMIRSSRTSSKYFTREDLHKLGIEDLQDLARRWKTGRLGQDCQITINGGEGKRLLTELSTSEIEFVELYLPTYPTGGAGMRGITNMRNSPTAKGMTSTSVRPAGPEECGMLGLIAWLPK